MTAWSWLRDRRREPGEVLLLVPPLVLLGFLCSQAGGLNFAYRYALPALPFLLIATGRVIRQVGSRWPGRILLAICLASNAAALLSARPSYLSFGNAFAGGLDGAQRQFLGSNYDWGQDLFRLKHWSDGHPRMKPLVVAFYGPMVPTEVGLEAGVPPSSFFSRPEGMPPGLAEPFYLAVSSNVLHGLPSFIDGGRGAYAAGILRSPWLRPENAVARVGSTIYVFRVAPRAEGAGARSLSFEQLSGCIEPITRADTTGTP